MLSLSVTVVLALAPPTGFTVSVERVPVSRVGGDARVKTEPLAATVVLEGLALIGRAPAACPTVERERGSITLRCTTRRLWAELAEDDKGLFLDLRVLRGVSWQGEASPLPLRAWPLTSVPLPDTCPGTLAAARGECALAQNDLEAARAAWTEGLEGPDASLCHLRLGDLAIRAGDPEAALAHYSKVSTIGPIAQMGQVRLCELVGSCLSRADSQALASVETLPAALAREVRLRSIRRELFAGRETASMQQLAAALEADPDTCEGALALCQALIGVGLISPEADARIAALSVFLTDKARKGGAEYALNEAASRAAAGLGAPAFAAAILAANTPKVPQAELAAHLLQVVRLYLLARDPVRAGVVLEYAESTLGNVTRAGPWREARRQLQGRRAQPGVAHRAPPPVRSVEELGNQVNISTELARAAAVRSRALTPSPTESPPHEP